MKKRFLLFISLFIFAFSNDSNYNKAINLMKNDDYKEAYNLFADDANNGNAKSQLMIGRFFLQGNKLVKMDYEKAMYYFKLASKQKEYEANCYISYMYANGLGVFPNFGRANVFAKKEFEKGNKLCIKVWNDFNLNKYQQDKGFRIGDYNKPIE